MKKILIIILIVIFIIGLAIFLFFFLRKRKKNKLINGINELEFKKNELEGIIKIPAPKNKEKVNFLKISLLLLLFESIHLLASTVSQK